MNNTFTQELTVMEHEASWWLSVYEALPDDTFNHASVTPSDFVVSKIKGFSKVFKVLKGCKEVLIIN